jgi:hypothetical protein
MNKEIKRLQKLAGLLKEEDNEFHVDAPEEWKYYENEGIFHKLKYELHYEEDVEFFIDGEEDNWYSWKCTAAGKLDQLMDWKPEYEDTIRFDKKEYSWWEFNKLLSLQGYESKSPLPSPISIIRNQNLNQLHNVEYEYNNNYFDNYNDFNNYMETLGVNLPEDETGEVFTEYFDEKIYI